MTVRRLEIFVMVIVIVDDNLISWFMIFLEFVRDDKQFLNIPIILMIGIAFDSIGNYIILERILYNKEI